MSAIKPKSAKRGERVLNLPSVELPITPITLEEIEKDMKRRVSSVAKELAGGFDFIKAHPKSVTFFGSARLPLDNAYSQKASRIGQRLAESGYSVVTGGGPGIMEAGNFGAYQAAGQSVGLTIKLPSEQNVNPYVTSFHEFYYFFTRKVCLTFSAEAYLYFPGGYGTLDEFFEILTLVQTNKISRVPIILVGEKFWKPIEQLIRTHLLEEFGTISPEDLDLFHITDDEDEIVEVVKKAPIHRGDGMEQNPDH